MGAAPHALRLRADMGSISLHLPDSLLSLTERGRKGEGEREMERQKRKEERQTKRERGQGTKQKRELEALISTEWGRGVQGRKEACCWEAGGERGWAMGEGCLRKQRDPWESSRDPGITVRGHNFSLKTGKT